jgi:hypothetical protein
MSCVARRLARPLSATDPVSLATIAPTMSARARLGRPVTLAIGLAAASALVFELLRRRVGVGLSSDSYSYLAWAERFLGEGTLDHTPYDFTAPKPLELLVATAGEAVGAPVAVFGTWAVLCYAGAVVAAGALARRFAGWPAALAAGALAATMPMLVRAGWAGDSTAPYAACVVGAAALAPGRVRPVAALLGLAGLLRPEGWGLAALHAALSWRGASREERMAAVAAAIVPPLLWLSFDWIATGDPLYGAHATERFGVVAAPLQDVPGELRQLIPDLVGWPLVLLGLAALAAGVRRRATDPAVLFPLALALGLLIELRLGLIGTVPLGRYALPLFLFLPAGAGIVLARAPGRARLPVLAAGTIACLALQVGSLRDLRDFFDRRSNLAAQLEERMAPAVERVVAGGGLVATESEWGGALAVHSEVPRDRIVPARAVGRAVDPEEVRAYLVIPELQVRRDGPVGAIDESRPLASSGLWRLYVPTRR